MTSKRHIDEWVCLFDERHVVKRAALGQGVLQPEKQLTMKVIIEIIRVMSSLHYLTLAGHLGPLCVKQCFI